MPGRKPACSAACLPCSSAHLTRRVFRTRAYSLGSTEPTAIGRTVSNDGAAGAAPGAGRLRRSVMDARCHSSGTRPAVKHVANTSAIAGASTYVNAPVASSAVRASRKNSGGMPAGPDAVPLRSFWSSATTSASVMGTPRAAAWRGVPRRCAARTPIVAAAAGPWAGGAANMRSKWVAAAAPLSRHAGSAAGRAPRARQKRRGLCIRSFSAAAACGWRYAARLRRSSRR